MDIFDGVVLITVAVVVGIVVVFISFHIYLARPHHNTSVSAEGPFFSYRMETKTPDDQMQAGMIRNRRSLCIEDQVD